MTNSEQVALDFLSCPLSWDWIEEQPNDNSEKIWILDWCHCCRLVAVSDSERFFIEDYLHYFELGAFVELRAISHNLKDRRPEAVRMYLKRLGSLNRLNFKMPSHDGKHFVTGSQDIVAKTKNGPSLFFNNYDSENLRRAFWHWLIRHFAFFRSETHTSFLEAYGSIISEDKSYMPPDASLWSSMISSHSYRIAFDTRNEIGAARGQITTCVCFAVNQTDAHAYPITRNEAEKVMGAEQLTISKSLW